MELFSIMGITLITAVLVVLIKQYRPEMALVLSVGAGAIILLTIILKATPLLNSVTNLIKSVGIKEEYVSIMLKSLGVCYLTQFSSDICNDFGQTSLGSKIELGGKIMLGIISLPMMVSLISLVTKMIG